MTKKECIQVYKCMIEAGRELDKISDKYLMAFGERLEVFDNVHLPEKMMNGSIGQEKISMKKIIEI